MASSAPGGGDSAVSDSSSSGATTNLTFVTLPLTSPGRSGDGGEELTSTAVSPSPDVLTFPPAPATVVSNPYHRSGSFSYGSAPSSPTGGGSFQYVSEKLQSRILSPSPSLTRKTSFLSRGVTPRDVAAQHPFSRAHSTLSDASLLGLPASSNWTKEDFINGKDKDLSRMDSKRAKFDAEGYGPSFARILRPGNRASKRLLVLIVLNFAYSTIEFLIGLFTRRIGLVSDAFHLTFGCGVLTFSLFAMMRADHPPDKAYTYGYKRLEVLAAFTNALFLLFLSFSLAVEALHAFVQDEAEHKHYLIVSAVANLLVNLLGVWFFRSYARVNVVYRKAQDINLHSICLHVLSDSVRSAGVILASWLLTFGVIYAETLCLGLVSVAIFLTTMPLFQASGAVLSQMAPSGTSAAALQKCIRQVRMLDDVVQCYNARFWDMVPGYIVGTLVMQVREGADEQSILKSVHSIYNEIGVKDLTVEIELYD